MKKLILLLITLLLTFGFVACDKESTTLSTNSAAVTTTENAIATSNTQTTVEVIDMTEFPEEDITLEFWHEFNSAQTVVLEEQIAAFELLYPNVTVNCTQYDSDNISWQVNNSLLMGTSPNLFTSSLLDLVKLNASNQLLILDQYLENDTTLDYNCSESSNYGETLALGYDTTNLLSGLIDSHLVENSGYVGLPFYFTTDVLMSNVAVLKSHITEIRNAGIDITDNGHLSYETPLSYDQLSLLNAILVEDTGSDTESMKTEFLLSYDIGSRLFLNTSKQWGLDVFDAAGNNLIDISKTEKMLEYLKILFDDNTVVMPAEWNASYASENFKQGDIALLVGNTSALRYSIPTANDLQENLKFGVFDVDVLPSPQFVTTQGEEITVNGVTFNANISLPFNTLSIGVFDKGDSLTSFWSYLLLTFLMDEDFVARMALIKDRLPATKLSYSSEEVFDLTTTVSISYDDFMNIAKEYWLNDGLVTWATDDYRWNYLHKSMAANIAYNQRDYYDSYPIFTTGFGLQDYEKLLEDFDTGIHDIYLDIYTPLVVLNNIGE